MKILHVIAQLPERTGSGVYYRNLVHSLTELGHQNALVYAIQEPFNHDIQKDFVFPVQFLSEDIPFPIAGMSDVMPYPNTIYSEMTESQITIWSNAFKKQLNDAKKTFKPDLVICHHLWYLCQITLDIFSDCPVIAISHSTDIRQAKRFPHLKDRYVPDLSSLSAVFALSYENMADIQEVYQIDPKKIKVMGNGYNPEIFYTHKKKTHSQQDPIKLIYAGKLVHSKGVFQLAQIYPSLKKKYPQIELHMIGMGEKAAKSQLHELACSGDIEGFFQYDPMPLQEDLADFMRQADIFILPSFYEGLPTIVLEAMACGLRTVVSQLPALHGLLESSLNSTGMIEYVPLPQLINQDQPVEADLPQFNQQLQLAIEKQIKRVQSNNPIASSTWEAIQAFSWPQLVQKEAKVLEEILSYR